jgi:hypothetical protein
MAAMHHFPHRPTATWSPCAVAVIRTAMTIGESIYWPITKGAADAQRRELGLARPEPHLAHRRHA